MIEILTDSCSLADGDIGASGDTTGSTLVDSEEPPATAGAHCIIGR